MLQRPSRAYALLLTALLVLLTTTGPAWAAEVDVTESTPNGWYGGVVHLYGETPTSEVELVQGPGNPPCGTGSVQLSVGEDGNSAAVIETINYNGLPLSQLTQLEYKTYVAATGSEWSGQAPFMLLDVDLDANGAHDQLIFDPSAQEQGTVTPGVWQTWNALDGLWWSLNENALVELDEYIDEHPGATLSYAGRDDIGALWIAAGFGAGAWDNFVGNVDCVTVGVAGAETTYDFEPGPTTTVDVGGVDSGVVNRVIGPGGRTIQDAVAECAVGVRNHGEFVSCITRLANDLRKAGVITNAESSALKQAAARSDVGKKKK